MSEGKINQARPDQSVFWLERVLNSRFAAAVRRNRTRLIYLLFVAVALAEGLYFSFKLPLAQVPDEISHYQLMEEEFGTTGYIDNIISGVYYPGGFYALPGNAEAKVDRAAAASVADVRFSPDLHFTFRPKLTILRHLPGGIGFYLGALLGLPMLTCTYLAEIFSVLFFVGLGYLALRITPLKKDIFAFCLLIPETLQQCASINYDAVLIPCAFLLFAWILRLWDREAPVRWRDLAIVALLAFVLLVVKPPYALIALTIFIIPAKRFQLKIGRRFELAGWIRRFWYVPLTLVLLAAAGGLYLMRDNSVVKTMLADVLYLPDFLSLIKRTFSGLGFYRLTQMVGMFGWLESQVSNLFVLAFFMMMIYLNACRLEKPRCELNPLRRGWLLLVGAAVILAIEVALQEWSYNYLSWDRTAGIESFCEYILMLPQILGVQGRYWIPCLPVLLVAVSGRNPRQHLKPYWAMQVCWYAFTFVYVMSVLNGRYWA